MTEGVDFSGPRPSAAALAAAGCSFVFRYARCFTHPKCITADEVDYWTANKVDVGIVEESSEDRALAGHDAGAADATAARDRIIAVGGPADGGVIYCAVDFAPTPDQMPTVGEYVRGFAAALGHDRAGVYAGLLAIRYILDRGLCRYGWQTYAWSSASSHTARPTDRIVDGTIWDPRCQVQQYRNSVTLGGVEVDLCRATMADFGQWNYQPTEDTLSAAEVQAITDKIDGVYRLLALGDEPEPAGGNTHPNNLRTVRRKLDSVIAAVAAQADDEAKVLGAVGAAEAADAARDAALAEAVAGVQAGGGVVDVDALSQRMYAAADRAIVERLGKAAAS